MITLNAKQALSQVVVSDEEQHDKNDLPYFRARYQGKGFIIRESVYADWKAGRMFELTLNETTREVTDSEGKTANVAGFEYAGHITGQQMIEISKTDVQLKKMDRELLATAPALEDIKELA